MNSPALLLPLFAAAWHRISTSSVFKFAPALNQLLLDVFETRGEDSDLSQSERRWYTICDMIFQGLSATAIREQIKLRLPEDSSPARLRAGSGAAVLSDCLAQSQYGVLSKIATKIRFGRPVYETDKKRKGLAVSARQASMAEGRFRAPRPRGKDQVCRICRLPWNDERAIGTRQKNIHQKNQWSDIHTLRCRVHKHIHTHIQTQPIGPTTMDASATIRSAAYAGGHRRSGIKVVSR